MPPVAPSPILKLISVFSLSRPTFDTSLTSGEQRCHLRLDRPDLRRQHRVDLIEIGLELWQLIARADLC